jgi:hypothetical protein
MPKVHAVSEFLPRSNLKSSGTASMWRVPFFVQALQLHCYSNPDRLA